MPRDSCPSCEGDKDTRAERCKSCAPAYRKSDPDRWYTAKNGYKSKRIKGKLYYQHRLIMEEALGRPLLDIEVVHHINHNPSDNRIENLELIESHSEHMKEHSNRTRNALGQWEKKDASI